ncbi:MAG TPA: glycosyltransferase family 4 protein [Candidatus Limnocylindria bacterium]|nr:glycosyltransferase family 4 protein [Candidatus Limnocylindria bacterium]
MRTLFVSREAPYPVRSGAPLRMWQNIELLATRGPVFAFSVGGVNDVVGVPPPLSGWLHVDRAEFEAKPARGIGRVKKILRPRQYPIDNDAVTGEMNRRLRAYIRAVRPDVIVLSHWVDACPDALKGFPSVIVDAHNVESVLARDLAHVHSPRRSLRRAFLDMRFRRRELKLFRQAKRVWVPSEHDARTVLELDRSLAKPIVWPNAVDVDSYAAVRTRTTADLDGLEPNGKTMIYVGFYWYPPNARAAQHLIEHTLPAVRRRHPDARLLLVGKDPTQLMLDAASRDEGILVTGCVADTRPYLALADVCPVPLTEGSGTRLKLLEAFSCGIPVVSTSKGAEGIEAGSGAEILIADDPERFAAAVAEVFDEPDRFRDQARRALELVRNRYSWDALADQLDDALPSSVPKRYDAATKRAGRASGPLRLRSRVVAKEGSDEVDRDREDRRRVMLGGDLR